MLEAVAEKTKIKDDEFDIHGDLAVTEVCAIATENAAHPESKHIPINNSSHLAN